MSKMLDTIQNRHSTRGYFDPHRPIERSHLKEILDAARWAPTPANMQNFEILVVENRAQIDAVGKIPAYISEAFLRENYEQLSFSEEELRNRKRGMLANEFPKAWTNPESWSPDSEYRFRLTELQELIKGAPLLLIALYDSQLHAPDSERDVLGQMGLGCLLENIWLMSESLGIGFHVLTVFNDSTVQTKVKNLLHVPGQLKIAFACCLGYPIKTEGAHPHVRRELETFVHHNTYGTKDVLWNARRTRSKLKSDQDSRAKPETVKRA